ncbi:MAG: hypothetical protein QOH83_2254 [Solirubrobacteraceae bacterium]|nr:hypothetical protein [Solirubrobacteraceae bacterium]
MTPDYSWGFFFPLVATIFAVMAFLVGAGLGVNTARGGRAGPAWLLGMYVALFLAQVLVGFRVMETVIVMSLGFVSGPLGYRFGRGFVPRDARDTDAPPEQRDHPQSG